MLPEMNHILYATDLSDNARHALRYAVSLAKSCKAELTMIHVLPDWVEIMSENAGIDIATHFDLATWENINTTAMTAAQVKAHKRVEEMAAECRLDDPDCPVAKATIKVLQGDATACILEELKNGAYDLVVMGAHGQGPFIDMLLGSVANKIVRMSPVPVVTVRLPKEG
nr:universal stress protein [uncultured Desulfobulbus sp.]